MFLENAKLTKVRFIKKGWKIRNEKVIITDAKGIPHNYEQTSCPACENLCKSGEISKQLRIETTVIP